MFIEKVKVYRIASIKRRIIKYEGYRDKISKAIKAERQILKRLEAKNE